MVTDKASTGSKKVTELSVEMHEGIIELGGERSWTETREAWLVRTARKAGISYRSAKTLFYKEKEYPKSSVVERVRIARAKTRKSEDAASESSITELRLQIAELAERIAKLDTANTPPPPQALRQASSQAGSEMD